MGLLKSSLEVTLNLSVVLGDCFRHALQVLVDLALLIDISDVFLTLSFHFINLSFELSNHVTHLLLVSYFFVHFTL